MKVTLVLIYVYGVLHVGYQHKDLFKKRVPLWEWKPGKDEYVVAVLSTVLWPITWTKNAIEFHLDRPYLKD